MIAILGEYDALPGLSQEAGIAVPKPVEVGGHGHGCGHNLLGSAALLAATAIKDWLAETGTPGRVRYYGCPAEEGGAAKAFMVRAGAFDDADIAISWHPASFWEVAPPLALANTRADFIFTGRASHAAAAPHLGRSALDAVELMSVGVNYMREHMPSDARVHYAYLEAGGIAPNVVQANARVRYSIRARDLPGMLELVERVKKIAQGAALMTETAVEVRIVSAVSNLLGNTPLERTLHGVMEELGPPHFDDGDRAFAREIRETLTEGDIAAMYRTIGMPTDGRAPGRLPRPLRCRAQPGHRLDRCRRRELGRADRAGPCPDGGARDAVPHLAGRGTGQGAGGPQGDGPGRQGDGRDRRNGADEPGTRGRRQGGSPDARRTNGVSVAASERGPTAARHVGRLDHNCFGPKRAGDIVIQSPSIVPSTSP